jgi:hypothetical protein
VLVATGVGAVCRGLKGVGGIAGGIGTEVDSAVGFGMGVDICDGVDGVIGVGFSPVPAVGVTVNIWVLDSMPSAGVEMVIGVGCDATGISILVSSG